MWVWLFDPTFGYINQFLSDLGLIDKPIQWLGTDADVSTWAIITSVVWKVLGFGMILFVAAIQAIPPRSTRRRWSTVPASGSARGGSPCR